MQTDKYIQDQEIAYKLLQVNQAIWRSVPDLNNTPPMLHNVLTWFNDSYAVNTPMSKQEFVNDTFRDSNGKTYAWNMKHGYLYDQSDELIEYLYSLM